MNLTFEYGKQKFTAELSDTERNARIALNLAWDLVDEHTKLIFMPDFSKRVQHPEIRENESPIKDALKKVKKNGGRNEGNLMTQKQNSYIKDSELIKKDEYGDEVLLWADFKNGCVNTNCADYYYN